MDTRGDGMRAANLFLTLALAATMAAAEPRGTARVTDGDTLVVDAVRVRLHGIDAPELAQRCGRDGGGDWACGQAAAAHLAALVAGREVRCEARERDVYGRVVATCAADGIDLGRRMVSEGLAWAYSRFSADYQAVEAEARAAGRGLWQGDAQAAWDWRNRATTAVSNRRAAAGCVIKGNITAAGERVYHTPASPWYARTRVDESAGEAWFCSAADAEAAGWRAAGHRE
jgi:endonuclease YncB( thermonuclease family)